MHEFSIARSIVESVRQHLPAGELRGVKSVKLRIGDRVGIAPESLTFCFELAGQGTALDGAKLEIEPVPGNELSVVEVDLEE
ncbi:MAG: hydrogenase maturation nickel metallochaperone HypA [Nitrospirae bacterium]|nr:hydrogenase maturation nickel metallochaperone HypA [Nitrospirota bacterium]